MMRRRAGALGRFSSDVAGSGARAPTLVVIKGIIAAGSGAQAGALATEIRIAALGVSGAAALIIIVRGDSARSSGGARRVQEVG